ncbi:MAG: hypothetical protein J6X92_02165, partial [Bacteroidales bacterium]|nr:hypothetical protein [Bacteroidales bacterium]
ILVSSVCKAQLSYNFSNGLAIIGEGDYKGYYLENSLDIPIKGRLYISTNLGFTMSFNSNEDYEERWHNSAFAELRIPLKYTVLQSSRVGVAVGCGPSARFRSEFFPYYSHKTYYNDGSYVYDFDYEMNTRIDFGYTIEASLLAYTNRKLSYGLNCAMNMYNSGTQLFIVYCSLKYRLK